MDLVLTVVGESGRISVNIDFLVLFCPLRFSDTKNSCNDKKLYVLAGFRDAEGRKTAI